MKKMKINCLKISGNDAETFLQGFITCDAKNLKTPIFSAACNQKGRMIANFWIWREADDFYLQLPESMMTILINHFKKYVFRSTIIFEIIEENLNNSLNHSVIWILPETTEKLIPQMVELEKQGGVSFKKGCYLGQEIIVRMEHLGQLKRHLHSFNVLNEQEMTIGDEIKNDKGEIVGIVVGIFDKMLSAVVEDRAIQEPLYWKDILLLK